MLEKSDLKVIRGGQLKRPVPEQKFIDAYATDTRLMGVLVIYIHWQLSGTLAIEGKDRSLHQFFYVETTEEGIESYQGIYGDDSEELQETEQSMLGGLGAQKQMLTMNEALFLVQGFAALNKQFGTQLPDEREEYAFVLARETNMSAEREAMLFHRISGAITSANQLINYFLMRYFAQDYYAADMLSAAPVPRDLMGNGGLATLCRNEIRRGVDDEGQRVFFCESVIEEDRGHRIVTSELRLLGEEAERGGRSAMPAEPESWKVASFAVLSAFAISEAEAAMKLARPEFVTVYEIAGPAENVLDELDDRYLGSLQNLTEGGKLYVCFTDDNRHVDGAVYRLNDDVKEILYVTVEDQLVLGAYTLSGIKRLENKMMLTSAAGQLIEVAKYEFKEPILYDYTLSYGGDFVRYVEDIMGFDPEEDT
ncbi:MAG: hypothetical protein LBS85_03475 [Clostridiales Family XIII bacterium]|jgi:hypothetical protein|nr:hypothetical protein [Clostridiales Family XIII bacterium]